MTNPLLKKLIPYLSVLVVFMAISLAYFSPDIFQNKTLFQSDSAAGASAGRELNEYRKTHDDKRSYWTNALFSGMPSYQIAPGYPSMTVVNKMKEATGAYLPGPANLLFMMLLGSFILFLALGMDYRVAVLGAVAYTFSSYFLILIHAGHIWKFLVLSYIPPTFAGIIWTYRGRYILGGAVAALFASFQLVSNHPQMTFYFGLMLMFYLVAEAIHAYKTKTYLRFVKASGILLVAGLLAFALNATNLYHSYQYAQYTMRGPSELTSNNSENLTKSGIDKDYATQWSYGIEETLTLLIPDTKGGASGLIESSPSNKKILNDLKASPDIQNYIFSGTSRYWGDQPFTSGPVYVGAFILFLFILGIGIVDGRLKWAMVGATILSILLSWGHNFMWLTDLFLDYFPMYNKFRAVASILVIAELTIPIVAMMALWKVIQEPTVLKTQSKAFYIALASTVGLAVLLYIFPNLLTFLTQQEIDGFNEAMKQPQQAAIYMQLSEGLQAVRINIFRSDILRSLFFILASVGCLWYYTLLASKPENKNKQTQAVKTSLISVLVGVLILLTLADLATVDKRYMSSKDFHTKRPTADFFPMTAADKEIKKDATLSYRVFNVSAGNPFSDGTTSFHHQSIGGYHAAKLRRYQDLIEHHIAKNNLSVINMLNTKYVIAGDEKNPVSQINPNALGNAWFVDQLIWVNNPDEEIAALSNFDPAKTAYADKAFATQLDGKYLQTSRDSTATVTLTSYEPNELKYTSQSEVDKLAVFSEIYYQHGWEAFIDGKPVDIIRVNYVLRALAIPAGKHEIEMRFDPQSIHLTESIAYGSVFILLLMLLGAIVFEVIAYRKKEVM